MCVEIGFGWDGWVWVGVGSLLCDRFVLDYEVGCGVMGVVYVVVDCWCLEVGYGEFYVVLKLFGDEVYLDVGVFCQFEVEV